MVILKYRAEQLLHLRNSPLVQKPDNLPAIEQWIEYVYLERGDGGREKLRIPHSEAAQPQQQFAQKRAPRPGAIAGGVGGESSPMGSFSTGQRPGLPRSAASRNGDDVSLGPPRTTFPSSRNVTRLSDLQDQAPPSEGAGSDASDNNRNRFFSERHQNRRTANEKDGRENRESWTSVRERRAFGAESDDLSQDKPARFGRFDKDQDGERRNGYGDRHDTRWSSNRDDRRQNGDRSGGWRDREQQRRDRENDRAYVEKDPEWMDDPVMKQEQELGMGMARTQEEFQKWKESMNKNKKGASEKEDIPELSAVPASVRAVTDPEPKPAVERLKLDGLDLGGWGGSNPASSTVPAQATKANAKKSSRFASMFKPVEEPAPEPESSVQKAANDFAKATAEDKVGFDRVLQMLGSTKSNTTPTPPEQAPTSPPPSKIVAANGKPKSRFTNLFEARSPERVQPNSEGGVSLGGDNSTNGMKRTTTDEPHQVQGGDGPGHAQPNQRLFGQPPSESSPDPFTAPFQMPQSRESQPSQSSRPASGRMNDFGPMFNPPSRGTATPDNNIQNLLAQSRSRPGINSNGSQHLLNILKMDASRTSEKQAGPGAQTPQGPPQIMPEVFQRYVNENQPGAEPHAPRPRMPNQPPGVFEEQLMRNFPQHHEPPVQQMQDIQLQQRRTSQRAPTAPPPGFVDEHMLLQQHHHLQQQQMRRQYEAQAQQQLQQQAQQGPNIAASRRMSGNPSMLPQQMPMPPGMPPQQHFQGHPQSDFPPGPPPPGFNPHMPRHHPPGFANIPTMFQQQQQPPRGDMLPSQQTQQASGFPPPGAGPTGPPPGFFGPPPQHMQQQQQMRALGRAGPGGFDGGGVSVYGMGMPPPGELGRR